jgi:hypothetical protein
MIPQVLQTIAEQMVQASLPEGHKLEKLEITSIKLKPYTGKYEGRTL